MAHKAGYASRGRLLLFMQALCFRLRLFATDELYFCHGLSRTDSELPFAQKTTDEHGLSPAALHALGFAALLAKNVHVMNTNKS